MRLSEFWLAVAREFGDEYGRVLTNDLVLGELGDITAAEAIRRGTPSGEVWHALCAATDVALERRHGVGLGDPHEP